MRTLFAALSLFAFTPRAFAAGVGCQDTNATRFGPLEKIRSNATGPQFLGCVNRSFEAIASSAAMLGAGTTNYMAKILVNEIGSLSMPNIWVSSPMAVGFSSSTVPADSVFATSGSAVFQSTTSTANHPVLTVRNISATEILRIQQNGNFGLGTNASKASAIFYASSTSKGFALEPITSAQMSAISAPTTGLMVMVGSQWRYYSAIDNGWVTISTNDTVGAAGGGLGANNTWTGNNVFQASVTANVGSVRWGSSLALQDVVVASAVFTAAGNFTLDVPISTASFHLRIAANHVTTNGYMYAQFNGDGGANYQSGSIRLDSGGTEAGTGSATDRCQLESVDTLPLAGNPGKVDFFFVTNRTEGSQAAGYALAANNYNIVTEAEHTRMSCAYNGANNISTIKISVSAGTITGAAYLIQEFTF